MNAELSENTKAILLLTAPLLAGNRRGTDSPLTLAEYNRLAARLAEHSREPADLLRPGGREVTDECQTGLDLMRIGRLLERGLLLSQAIERWRNRAIWVVSRADAEYPRRFKERLGASAPPIIYGCGEPSLLENGGLAVVGSREVCQELIEYTEDVGRMAAQAECTVVSGAARGVDQAAMYGALTAGGTASGVLTGGLEGAAINREHRDMLLDGQLVLVTPYDPKAGFNVGNAMHRNKLIYALADAGLVIESTNGSGGTWAGAVEQIDKLRLVPVYTRSDGDTSPGLRALQRKGAKVWPNPSTPDEFKSLLASGYLPPNAGDTQPAFPLLESGVGAAPWGDSAVTVPPARLTGGSEPNAAIKDLSPADYLFAEVEKLIDDVGSPVRESDIADHLRIEKKQAGAWLQRLVDEGKYVRKSRPVRYVRSNRIL